MQKQLRFVPNEQNVVSKLFHFPVVQIMCYPFTVLLNLSHLSWPIGNSLLTNAQLLNELFLGWRIIFVQQSLQFHNYDFLSGFSLFLVCNLEAATFETPKPPFTRILR